METILIRLSSTLAKRKYNHILISLLVCHVVGPTEVVT